MMSGFGLLLVALVAVVLFLWFARRKPDDSGSSARAPTPVSRPSARVRDPIMTGVESSAARSTGEGDDPADDEPLPEALAGFRLLLAGDIDDEVRSTVQQLCESLPEPHPVHAQLAGGLDDPAELMDVVASDAGLTASVLRTVNSAAFSLTSPISSVQHAITYLGVSFVKGLVAQAAVAENLQEGSPQQLEALGRIWKSASSASAVAQMLGQELGRNRPSVLATKALFFNLGDVAMVMGHDTAHSWYGEGVSIVDRIGAQQQAIGANSAIVGAALARHWHLPEEIALATEGGFLPLVTPPTQLPLEGDERADAVLLYLASRVGDRVTYRGLRDIGELDLDSREEPGLFYLKGHLTAAGVERVPTLLKDAAFRRKANRLLATLSI